MMHMKRLDQKDHEIFNTTKIFEYTKKLNRYFWRYQI